MPNTPEGIQTLQHILGLNSALCKKPLVSRYVHYSDVATCQDASILLNCTENPRDVYQQETVKKVDAGS